MQVTRSEEARKSPPTASLLRRTAGLAAAVAVSAQLAVAPGLRAQSPEYYPGLASDKDGVPRPGNVGGTNYASVPAWIQNAALFDIAFGIKYPGDWWDIGAYEFYPGKFPWMPLLHNPETSSYLSLDAPTNFRIVSGGSTNTPGGTNQSPSSSDPTINSIQGKLGQLAQLAAALPADSYYQGLHDYFTNQCMAKFFFSSSSSLYAFYYNGSLGGNEIQIADFPATPGLQGNEYIKTMQTLQFGTDWFTNLFTDTEVTNIQFASQGGLYTWLFLADSSKKIKMYYGEPFFNAVLADGDAVQRAMTGQSTSQEITNINQALGTIVNGSAPAQQGTNVMLRFERVYLGTNGNPLYDQTLNLVISNLQAARIP